MVRFILFNLTGTGPLPMFIDDTDSGYNGKDVLAKPGVYEEVVNSEAFSLQLAELSGGIDGYTTKCIGLLAVSNPEATTGAKQLVDMTDKVKPLLTVPETAAKILLKKESEEMQEFIASALDTIHYYESLTLESKVFLPESAFQYMDEEASKRMRSSRHVYALRGVDNQEIVQKTCTDPYGVVLATVDELHRGAASAVSALDILRVIAPCRKEVRPGLYQYNGVYHTPYYRVDPKLHGMVPGYLNWLTGYSKNDLQGIQPFERHMYDNLKMLVCSDTASYVSEITTGMVFHTSFGQALKRLLSCRNAEILPDLVSSVNTAVPEGVSCNLEVLAVQGAFEAGTLSDHVGKLISVSAEAMVAIIDDALKTTRVIDVDNLPFVLTWGDEEKEKFTSILLERSVITRAVFDYILQLCCKAYDVNWGHSGAARAIPRFVVTQGIQAMNEVLAAHLNKVFGGQSANTDADFSLLYKNTSETDEDDSFGEDDGEDELLADFDYYITSDTAHRLMSGALEADFFSGGVSSVETSESAIVEYWRKVNGDSGVNYFISSAFSQTGDLNVLLESFIKLMRWGDMKPTLLVFENHPEIRTVFDLNVGKEIPNTAIVDESNLIPVNGCQYSLVGILRATDMGTGTEDAVVGFLLAKDYGVKKYFMASWIDVGEMIATGAIDIADFKTVTSVALRGENVYNISDLGTSGFGFHVSSRNIDEGLKYNVQPAALSELALLIVPGVLRSPEYLKSKQTTMLVTTKDRQYKILSDYVNTLRALYKSESATLEVEETTTAVLSAIAKKAYEIHTSTATAIPEANEVRAAQALSGLNLEGSVPQIQYYDGPLDKKCAFIADLEMQSGMAPMDFTDASVKKVAEQLRNLVVMLVMETEDSLILCRKDLAASEVLVKDQKIQWKRYSTYAPAIERIKQGSNPRVNLPDGSKKTAMAHESLRGLL